MGGGGDASTPHSIARYSQFVWCALHICTNVPDKLRNLAIRVVARVWPSHGESVIRTGPSQEAESEFKSRRVRGEGPHHHQDAKYLEGKDTKYDYMHVDHCTI